MKNYIAEESRVQLTFPIVIAFLSLRHIFHEIHEFAHMIVGRLICGYWGSRDFNRVQPISEGCENNEHLYVLAAIAGPLFNYFMIGTGTWILIKYFQNPRRVAMGIILIFASLPFARFFTVLIGGGDELGIIRSFIEEPLASRIVGITAVTLLLAYPLFKVFCALPQNRRHHYFWGLLLFPMILEGAVVLGFFNFLLANGFLSQPGIFGAPVLVIIVFIFSLVTFLFYRKSLPGFITTRTKGKGQESDFNIPKGGEWEIN